MAPTMKLVIASMMISTLKAQESAPVDVQTEDAATVQVVEADKLNTVAKPATYASRAADLQKFASDNINAAGKGLWSLGSSAIDTVYTNPITTTGTTALLVAVIVSYNNGYLNGFEQAPADIMAVPEKLFASVTGTYEYVNGLSTVAREALCTRLTAALGASASIATWTTTKAGDINASIVKLANESWFVKAAGEAAAKVAETASNATNAAGQAAGTASTFVTQAAGNVSNLVGQAAGTASTFVTQAAGNVSNLVGQAAGNASELIGQAVGNASNFIGQAAGTPLLQTATNASDIMVATAGNALDIAAAAAGNASTIIV